MEERVHEVVDDLTTSPSSLIRSALGRTRVVADVAAAARLTA